MSGYKLYDKDIQTVLKHLRAIKPDATEENAKQLLLNEKIKARNIGWYSPAGLIDLYEEHFGTKASPRNQEVLGRVKKLYETKILAVRNYKSDKYEFRVNDFLNLGELSQILEEIDTRESDITPAGHTFLKEYYGYRNVAKKMILGDDRYLYDPKDEKTNEKIDNYASWLENLEPMWTVRFFEESRGNIEPGANLIEELTSPDSPD